MVLLVMQHAGALRAHPPAPTAPLAPHAEARRIVWVAVAEGRGHLMRAHLAGELLAPEGIAVDVMTTSAAGAAFVAELGGRAARLSSRYALAYDDQQNLARGRTRAMVLRYLASPSGCARDLAAIAARARGAALVVNDSFHPALLAATLAGGALARRVVHVHGENTRLAVEGDAGVLGPLIRAALARAPRIEITLAGAAGPGDAPGVVRVPPLLPRPRARSLVRAELGVPAGRRLAAVYLNPYFHDPALAAAPRTRSRARASRCTRWARASPGGRAGARATPRSPTWSPRPTCSCRRPAPARSRSRARPRCR